MNKRLETLKDLEGCSYWSSNKPEPCVDKEELKQTARDWVDKLCKIPDNKCFCLTCKKILDDCECHHSKSILLNNCDYEGDLSGALKFIYAFFNLNEKQ